MTQIAFGRFEPSYAIRPCPQHGQVRREMEMWTGGTDYVCPMCKDTDLAIGIIFRLIHTGLKPDRYFSHSMSQEGVAVLGRAMRHLIADQHWRAKNEQV